MKLTHSLIFRFSSSKIAKLKEYKIPSLSPEITKNNTIWLHGMFDSSKNLLNLASNSNLRRITNQYLIDARNHGQSEHKDTITFNNMADDLVHYINKKKLDNIYLIGHSMGGRTIMSALQEHKSYLQPKVKGVIIVDVMPSSYAVKGKSGPTDQLLRFMHEMKSVNISNKTFDQVKEEVYARFTPITIAQTILSNIDVLPNGQMRWCVNFNAIEKCYDELMEHETKNCYWQGPRKIIYGGKSKFTSLKRISEDFPPVFADFNLDRDVVEFENSAHFLYAKEPERFINEISNFIESVDQQQQEFIYSNNENKYYQEQIALEL